MTLGEYADVMASDVLHRVQLGEIRTLDGVEDYIAEGVKTFFDKYGGNIAAQLAAYAEPAAKKAVETVKPALQEVLTEYTPTFAAVAGGMIAISVLMGVWIAKRR